MSDTTKEKQRPKLFKFIPSEYKNAEGTHPLEQFDGYINLRPPTFDESMEYIEACGIEHDGNGEANVQKVELKQLRALVKCSRPHYVDVKLKNKDTGDEYKSLEDLDVDPECRGLMSIVGSLVLRGFRPSKNLKAPLK